LHGFGPRLADLQDRSALGGRQRDRRTARAATWWPNFERRMAASPVWL